MKNEQAPPPAGLGRWRGFCAMYRYLRSIGSRRLGAAIDSARWARVFGRKVDACPKEVA